MNLVFAHDHIFYRDNGKMYSNGSLSKSVLERYTSVFKEVTVLSRQKDLSGSSERLSLSSTKNIDFVEVPNFKSLKGYYLKTKAKSIVNQEVRKCDAVIARLPSSIGNMAVNAAIENQKPYLIEVVTCPWDALWNYSLEGKVIAPFAYLKMKRYVKNASHAIYVTEEFLQRRYPTNGKNINCSNVMLNEFDEEVLQARIKKISISDRHRVFVIGTIAAVDVRHKGQQYIIKALSQLKKRGITNYEYHLVGGGDQSYLRSIARKYNVIDQVKFLDSKKHSEVFEWLDTIDLYAQPSRQEGLPRALIEAMSRGLPAFGGRTAGIPELLESKCIFSNTRQNTEEICSILEAFDTDLMIKQAERNYYESKKYDIITIEKRRKQFFLEFIDSFQNQKV